MTLPPYSKQLIDRLNIGWSPWMILIYCGTDAWQKAKTINTHREDIHALVYDFRDDPADFDWPVTGFLVVVNWQRPVLAEQIRALVVCLLSDGAESVTVRPLFTDTEKSTHMISWESGQYEWVQVQETMQTYFAGE